MSERRIRIGNQTAFSALTPTQPFEYAVGNDFDAFEWFPDKKESGVGWEENDLDAEARRYIKNTALEHDIRLSVHAPWQVNPLQPKAWERLLEDLEFARDIGASLLNIHLYTDEGMASYVQSIIPLVKHLARVGIKLSIENTPFTGPEDFNELFGQLRNLGSDDTAHVGMCLDLGHANLCEATLNDYLKFIDLLDPQVPIIHIHMHENYGDYDIHLPLFSGPAGEDASGIEGLTERLKRRSFSGCIILEQWPQPPTLLNEARNRLREMIEKSPLPPFRKGGDLEGSALSRLLSPRLPLLALFDKRIEGDDALLHLANLRFKEGGLGTELYADTPAELEWLLRFRPTPEAPAAVHLSRGINLFEEESVKLIVDFAESFKDRVFGLVIHDQVEIATRFDDYLAALRTMESRIKEVEGGPYLFIEYAVGLEPELFIELFKAILDLRRVSACVDIGHIGLWEARSVYSRKHPGEDVCAITPHDPELPELIEDVQGAVRSALDAVLHVIRALGHLGKPLHSHLHDAHPLSIISSFGISDHLSFLDEIPIPFEYKGKKSLRPMFGPSGLLKIVTESLQLLGADRVSFALEIHPIEGRLPLGDASYLFNQWEDKGNAERMNYWLSVLLRNHQLVSEACEKSLL